MPLVLRPPGDAVPLPDRLAALGRGRRRAAVLGELFRLAAAAVAAVALAAGLDAAVHLPPAIRAGLLAGVLALVGGLWLGGVRRAARLSAHPLDVALLLEDRFPPLNDALASAVEFLSADAPSADRLGAARFRSVTLIRAENVARRFDLDSVVPSGRAWRWLWAATVAAALAAAAASVAPGRAAVALLRLADPYGGHAFPTRTTVELLDPPTLLAKGSPYDLRFVVRGRVPESATVSVRPAGTLAAHDDAVPLPADGRGDRPDEHRAEFRLDPTRAADSFEFRVTANDADTGWRPVTVAPPPTLVPLDGRPSPRVRLTFPAYTDLPPAELPDGTGVVETTAGTVVHFRAAADRRIAAAAFHFQGEPGPARAAEAVAGVASVNPLSATAAALLAGEFARPIPVAVSADGTRLAADFVPRLPGLYALRFTDEAGLTGVRLFDLRVLPDPAPVVALTRPDPARDPLTLLPTASVPIQVRAEDRVFGVRDVVLEYRVGGPDAPFRRLPLADLAAAGRLLPAVAGAVPPTAPKPVGLGAELTVPVARFAKPDGSPPADGDVVTVRAASTDWDDVAWTKEPGRSPEVEIRVLGRPSLEAEIQKELAGIRPELLRLREEQRAAREQAAEVRKAAAAGAVNPDDAGKLARAEQAQRGVRNKVADPADGVRAKADRLRQAAAANALPRSPTTDRLGAVADDLGRLADRHLDAADPAVAAARQEADKGAAGGDARPDPKAVAGLLDRADKHQKDAEDALDRVLERLEQWAGAGEVRGEARAVKDKLGQAGAAADKARPPAGTDPADLSPAQKAAVGAAADQLDQLADQADALLGKAARLAVEKDRQARDLNKQAADPAKAADADALARAAAKAQAEADALRGALDAAGGQALPRDLRGSADALRRNQPDRAAAARQQAADRLDKLTDGLSEKPPAGDELAKSRDAAADELQKLGAEQDELRKKAKAAADLPDPQERAEALKKLAAEQERLRRKAEVVAEKLTRERNDPAAAAVRQAAERMDAARDQLEQGDAPGDKQEATLDKLDEALDRLERDQKQSEERLTREKQEELAERLKGFRDRQKAADAEAGRIAKAVATAKGWDRPLLASLADLEDRERALADEVRGFADKSLADVPVFARLATQAAAAMKRAADLAAERRDDAGADDFDPELEAAADARVRRPMQTALRRLDQILDAFNNEPKKPEAKAAAGDPPPPAGDPPGDPGDGGRPGGVPPLAQLKALRAVQAEVNERTAAFAKAHPDPDALSDDDRAELKELEQTQREVAELFDKLADLVRPSGPEVP